MPRDIMVDQIGCRIGGGAPPNNDDASAECYRVTVQGGSDTPEGWYELARYELTKTEHAVLVAIVPQLWPGAEVEELSTELKRGGLRGTIHERGEPADVESGLQVWFVSVSKMAQVTEERHVSRLTARA